MTDTDQMVTWLHAAMDAAERGAEEATPGPWEPEGPMLLDVVTSALLGRVADCSVGTGYRPQSLPDARHIARHHPAAVLRRIAADRELLNGFLAETHHVVEDPAYTCPAARNERDGGQTWTKYQGACDCGLVTRTERRVRLLAEGYGWTETPSTPGWPECMCTPSGECGKCWEKRQRGTT